MKTQNRLFNSALLVIFWLLALILSSSCQDSNPLAPSNNDIQAVIDTTGPWNASDVPSGVLGQWLVDKDTTLTISSDSIIIRHSSARGYYKIIRNESNGRTNRLILQTGNNPYFNLFRIIYLSPNTETQILTAWGLQTARSEMEVFSADLGMVHTCILRGTWIKADSYPLPTGTWISDDDSLDLEFKINSVGFADRNWQIVAVETDYTDYRLILNDASDYFCLYWNHQSPYPNWNAALSDGIASNAENARALARIDWKRIREYKNFFTLFPLKTGARWTYDYSYSDMLYSEQYMMRSSRTEYLRKGSLILECISAQESAQSEMRFSMKTTFVITEETQKDQGWESVRDPVTKEYSHRTWNTATSFNDTTVTDEFILESDQNKVWMVRNGVIKGYAVIKHRVMYGFNMMIFSYPVPGKPNDIEFYGSFEEGRGIVSCSERKCLGGIGFGYDRTLNLSLKEYIPGSP